MSNVTLVTGFLLVGFSDVPELQILHGVLFLVIYLAAVMSNLLIITFIILDLQLHTPMYFFLKNLSSFDVLLVSVPIPKSIVNSLTHNYSVSFLGCAFQLLLMTSFAAGETFVLTAMSYDCYIAICYPLHYGAIMNGGTCILMASVSWAIGGLLGALFTAGAFSKPFCGFNVIPQFFCDIPSLLKIFCSESLVVAYTSIGICMFLGVSVKTFIHKPSSYHSFYYFYHNCCFCLSEAIFKYTISYGKLLSVLYTNLPPILNLIYSLRNKDMKKALVNLLSKMHALEAH